MLSVDSEMLAMAKAWRQSVDSEMVAMVATAMGKRWRRQQWESISGQYVQAFKIVSKRLGYWQPRRHTKLFDLQLQITAQTNSATTEIHFNEFEVLHFWVH